MEVSDYVSANNIQKILLRYIRTDLNRRAVLLNGSWGCGKTHFIEHKIFTSLEMDNQQAEEQKNQLPENERPKKYRVARVSLYGVASREEADKRVKASLLSHKEALMNKAADLAGNLAGDFVGQYAEFLADVVKDAAKEAADTLNQRKNQKENITTALVLDDFERSAMNPVELLGLINNYAENDGYKVILLADEENLAFSDDGKPEMVALCDCILEHKGELFPDKTTPKDFDKRLRALAESLSPAREIYNRAKEKVIGLELRFRPDFHASVKEIIGDYRKKHSPQDAAHSPQDAAHNPPVENVWYFIKKNQTSLTDPFVAFRNHNLRTVIAALLAANDLLPPILAMIPQSSDDKEKKALLEEAQNCLQYIAYAQIVKSQNQSPFSFNPLPTRNFQSFSVKTPETYKQVSLTWYRFVDVYIKTGLVKEGQIQETVNEAVAERLKAWRKAEYKELTLFRLKDEQWKRLEDEDVENGVKAIFRELSNGEYLPQDFREIIITLMDINDANNGLKEWTSIPIKEYVNLMKRCVTPDNSAYFFGDSFPGPPYDASKKYAKQYEEYVEPLRDVIRQCENQCEQNDAEGIRDLFYSKDKLDLNKFPTLATNGWQTFSDDGRFLSLWSADELANSLSNASANEIANFTDGLLTIYSVENYASAFPNDGPVVSELLDKLNGVSPSKRTRLLQLNQLKEELKSIKEEFDALP